ncbi:MAG: hypothetical protein ACI8W3_001663 [Myxococcota bacterium]
MKGAAPIANRVEAARFARLGPFQNIVSQSAHGGEIYDENSRLCSDLACESSKRFRALLTTAIRGASRTGEIDLKAAGLTVTSTAGRGRD